MHIVTMAAVQNMASNPQSLDRNTFHAATRPSPSPQVRLLR